MKATLGVRKGVQRRDAVARSTHAKSGPRALGHERRRSKSSKGMHLAASPAAREGVPSKELLRRMTKIEKQVAAVREEVRSSLLAGAAAELRAVNAEQARAGLERLHVDLIEMKEKGITGERVQASYSQTAEDVI